MHKHLTPLPRTFALCAAAAVAALAAAACLHAATSSSWRDAGSYHAIDSEGPNRVTLLIRQAGMPDGSDDTRIVTTPDGSQHHVSGYVAIDVTGSQFNVPADAKSVDIALKAVITKGVNEGNANVYAFVRRFGSAECQGVGAGNANFPTDHFDIPCMVVHAVSNLPRDGQRSCCATYRVPLDSGKFEFSWGYRRVEGEYPQGDALGIAVYLNGWTR